MFSRKSGDTVYNTLKSLKVQYAVLDKDWCLPTRPTPGCAIPEIWDFEDPDNAGKGTFCNDVPNYRHLFELAYMNSQYRVLKLK